MKSALIYDGDCGFCSACIRWGFKNLGVMPESIPFQFAELEQFGLSLEQAQSKVWLVTSSEHLGGHRAVAGLLRMQKSSFIWQTLGRIMTAPGLNWIFALGYRLVVRFRHLLPGATADCALPAKGQESAR